MTILSICMNGFNIPLQFILVNRWLSSSIEEMHTLTAYKLINEKWIFVEVSRVHAWWTGTPKWIVRTCILSGNSERTHQSGQTN